MLLNLSFIFGVTSPYMPAEAISRYPRMVVRGVLSSCEMVSTRLSFILSRSFISSNAIWSCSKFCRSSSLSLAFSSAIAACAAKGSATAHSTPVNFLLLSL